MVSLFQDLTFVNSIREYLEPKEWLFLMLSNKTVHESHCLWENSKKEILIWLKSRLEDPFESEYSKNNVRTYIAALESGFLVSHQGRFIVFVKNEELTDGGWLLLQSFSCEKDVVKDVRLKDYEKTMLILYQ
jgi:hypothetical protein